MEINQSIKINAVNYKILTQINTDNSAISDLWQAEDKQGKLVVIKTVKTSAFLDASDETKEKFLEHLNREIEFLSQQQKSPCHFIISLLNSGTYNKLPALVLPFIPLNLAEYIKQSNKVALVQHLDWCLQISLGLASIHRAGYFYRDLKLSNILTNSKGETLKLIDFGTAKLNTTNKLHTYSGTPSRMAPEQMLPINRHQQADGRYHYEYETDHRTDFFALGLILFELITGIQELTSQHDIQSLRENQGAQAAWEKRNDLGGINTREVKLFEDQLMRNHDAQAHSTFMQDAQRPEYIGELTALISSLLARDKNDRPDSAELIIDSLSKIIIPLAGDSNIYAFTAKDEAPYPVENHAKHFSTYRYFYIAAFTISSFAASYFYPTIKAQLLSQSRPPSLLTELPFDDFEPIAAIKIEQKKLRSSTAVPELNTSLTDNKTLEVQETKKPSIEATQPTIISIAKPEVKIPPTDNKTLEVQEVKKSSTEAIQATIISVAKPEVKIPPTDNKLPEVQEVKKPSIEATQPILISVAKPEVKIPLNGNKILAVKDNIEPSFPAKIAHNFPIENMLYINSDIFIMGNDQGNYDEKPERQVSIQPFYVSQRLVTEKQYHEYCINTRQACAESNKISQKPITQINKQEALDYISYLTRQSSYSVRLLSEAEWEYLAINKKVIFNHLEWTADCIHYNYKGAPMNAVAWLGENKGNCQMSSLRGNSVGKDLTNKAQHNRFPAPNTIKKNNLGFRVAFHLSQENKND